MASPLCVLCSQALAPAGSLNHLLDFLYHLEASYAYSSLSLGEGRYVFGGSSLLERETCAQCPAVWSDKGMSCLKWSVTFSFKHSCTGCPPSYMQSSSIPADSTWKKSNRQETNF